MGRGKKGSGAREKILFTKINRKSLPLPLSTLDDVPSEEYSTHLNYKNSQNQFLLPLLKFTELGDIVRPWETFLAEKSEKIEKAKENC